LILCDAALLAAIHQFFLLFWALMSFLTTTTTTKAWTFFREEESPRYFERCAVGTRTTIDQPGDCFCSLARSLVVVYVALFIFALDGVERIN